MHSFSIIGARRPPPMRVVIGARARYTLVCCPPTGRAVDRIAGYFPETLYSRGINAGSNRDVIRRVWFRRCTRTDDAPNVGHSGHRPQVRATVCGGPHLRVGLEGRSDFTAVAAVPAVEQRIVGQFALHAQQVGSSSVDRRVAAARQPGRRFAGADGT